MNEYTVAKTVDNVTSTYTVMNPTEGIDLESLTYTYVADESTVPYNIVKEAQT